MKITRPKFGPDDEVAAETGDIIIFAKIERCIYDKQTNSWTYFIEGVGTFDENKIHKLLFEFGTDKAILTSD